MKNLFWSILFISVIFCTNAAAQGELDTSFGSNGLQTASFGFSARATDVVTQPDRKIVVVGYCGGLGFTDICVARYNEDGSLDITFGGTGAVRTDAGISSAAYAVVLQQDGKIILAGTSTTSIAGDQTSDVLLVRYNPDGTLDQSFGSGGIALANAGPYNLDRAMDMAIQPDGKILIAGASTLYVPPTGQTNTQGFAARFLSDGTLDTSFGTAGFYRMDMDQQTYAFSIALQNDGKVLFGGGFPPMTVGGTGAALAIRLNTDGSPDPAWGNGGILRIDGTPQSSNQFLSLAIQRDGRVLATTGDNLIYRFNGDGSFDMSFNGTGFHGPAIVEPGSSSNPTKVLTLAGGRIMVVGLVSLSTSSFSRFSADGTLDNTFSADGRFSIGDDGFGRSATVDGHGRIVAVGEADLRFGVARLVAPPPVPVSVSGRVTRANGTPVSNITLSLTLNGTTIATARTSPFGYYSFPNVMTGAQYSIVIKARGALFPRRDIFVADDVENLDIVEGQPAANATEIKGESTDYRYDGKSPR